MKKILLVVLMFFVLISTSWAEPKLRVIALKDGSSIQGRLVGIERGSYVVDSPTLGELRVKEDEVVSISSLGEVVAASPGQPQGSGSFPPSSGVDLAGAQARILSDPGLMVDIQALASDPEVLALISDPAFMQAVQAKDMAAIQSNGRTAQLMANPKIKALIEKMQGAQSR